jgi:hypothetical protein
VHHKLRAEEVQTKLAEFDLLPAKEKRPTKEQCEMMTTVTDVIEGRRTLDKPATFKDPRDKEIAARYARAVHESCETGNLDPIRQAYVESPQQETRTCRVSSSTFEQTFRRISDEIKGAFSWVAHTSPTGACGIVQLSRFEPQKMPASQLTFRNCLARKAITNPKAEASPGMQCSDFDENIGVYSWRSDVGKSWVDCDKIEFSVL